LPIQLHESLELIQVFLQLTQLFGQLMLNILLHLQGDGQLHVVILQLGQLLFENQVRVCLVSWLTVLVVHALHLLVILCLLTSDSGCLLQCQQLLLQFHLDFDLTRPLIL
jgi:hypothetical protein